MKNKLFTLFTLALLSTTSSQLSTALAQGPLAPPGAPGPLFKTLQQVEPRTPIATLPFTILQKGSYYLTTNLTGITNLHGIEIAADDVTLDLNGFSLIGAPGSLKGVQVVSGRKNITIQNGSVRAWGGDGIGINDTSVASLQVLGVRASNNGQTGIRTASGGAVRDCVARENGLHGIHVEDSTAIERCSALMNASNGIVAYVQCRIENCLADGNSGNGINVFGASTVRRCDASQNGFDGIRVANGCSVLDNRSSENGTAGDGAGVHAVGVHNRIEANHATGNDTGIAVDSSNGNLVIRNSAVGNGTDFDLPPAASAGPVVVADAVTTNSNPHANFRP